MRTDTVPSRKIITSIPILRGSAVLRFNANFYFPFSEVVLVSNLCQLNVKQWILIILFFFLSLLFSFSLCLCRCTCSSFCFQTNLGKYWFTLFSLVLLWFDIGRPTCLLILTLCTPQSVYSQSENYAVQNVEDKIWNIYCLRRKKINKSWF